MNVSEISKQANTYVAPVTSNAAKTQSVDPVSNKTEQASTKKSEESTSAARKDQFVSAPDTTPVTYSKKESSKVTANQLMEMQQQRTNSFTQMLYSMITKQGQKSNLSLFGLDLTVTKETSSAAAASIAPGGEYSVDAVADRILSMAKALANGDESKISELRTAVEKGFKAAGVDFGGKLPSICQDTYSKVMKDFDEWENSFSKEAS